MGSNHSSTPDCLLWLAGPVSGAPSEVVKPSDGRASLLESIRNAGGIGKAQLRNVKERKMEKKKQKEQEQGVRLFERGCVSAHVLLTATWCSSNNDGKVMQSKQSVTSH